MMKYKYDPEENIIHLKASGVLVPEDPITYFHEVAKDRSIKPDAVERVYFQKLEKITFTYNSAMKIADTFKRLKHDERLSSTVFITDSDLSFAMARMVVSTIGHPSHEFRIERVEQ